MNKTHNPMKDAWTPFEWDTNVRAYKSVCLCSILCTKAHYQFSRQGKVYLSLERLEAARDGGKVEAYCQPCGVHHESK